MDIFKRFLSCNFNVFNNPILLQAGVHSRKIIRAGVMSMSARNETPHVILQTLGQKKCNGDWDASTENLSMDQVKQVAEKQKDRLTGATLYARSREVMGTCVAMRIKVEGMEPKAALIAMKEGRFDEHFE